MKRTVRKIDIKEEVLDVDSKLTYINLFKKDNDLDIFDPSSNVSPYDIIKLEYNIYEVMKNGISEFYAIQDKDLFDKLLMIGEGKLEQIKRNHYNTGIESGFREGRDVGVFEGENRKIKEIKSLSWWERLFKRF